MTTTPPEAPEAGPSPSAGDTGPRVTRDEVRELGRIRRTTGPHRKVAGVAGGLARHLDIDPILLRVAFVVLVFFGGVGLLLYVACWALLPEDGAARAPLGLDDRSRTVALIVFAAISALLLLGQTVGARHVPFPLALLGVLALAALVLLDRRRPRPTAPPVPHTPDPVTGAFAPTYAAPATAPYAAPYVPAHAPQPVYRHPRKRGPVLFWWTLFLSAVLVAGLGVLDLAGVPVADAAYPAVVAGTCGVVLLLSAFWGRGGGLVLVGLLAAIAMGVTAVSGTIDGADISRTPVTADAVPDHLSTGAGEIVLDLTKVTDPAALDGRTLTQRVRAGRIEVIVPDGWGLRVDASVTGAGHVQLFDSERGGFDLSDTYGTGADPGLPTLTLDAQAFAGEIQIHHPGQELVQ